MRDTIVEEGAALRALLERLERENAERMAQARGGTEPVE